MGLASGDVVERDMRSVGAKLADGSIAVDPDGKVTVLLDRTSVSADSAAERSVLMQNERQRLALGFPDTFLSKDETLLVKTWEVRRLWNDAMASFNALDKWGHSHCVYGESAGWEDAVQFLKTTKKYGSNRYGQASDEPGFPLRPDNVNRSMDYNLSTCGWCGRNSLGFSRCVNCTDVFYCKKECQVMHWKYGRHKTECNSKK